MEWIEKGSGKHKKLKGIQTYPPHIVSAHGMEEYCHRRDIEWEVELHFLEAGNKDSSVHPNVQSILD